MGPQQPARAQDRAGSFGAVADDYDRWRPGPSAAAVDWLLPPGAHRVLDLGAGTGALSRMLVGRVDEVVSVEPDPRMREVLSRRVPEATVLEGRGERLPVADASVDAILVSSAWHWMAVEPTIAEAARALRAGGVLGVVWSGPDWADDWFNGLRQVAERNASYGGLLSVLVNQVVDEDSRTLILPTGAPFTRPEHIVIGSELHLSADQLVGMVGTLSSIILLDEAQRREVLDDTRRLLGEAAGLVGDATAQLPFTADCWRSSTTNH